MIDTLADQLAEGRVKVYSCDSVAGRVMFAGEGSPAHQMWILDQFFEFVRWELVPAIRTDCRNDEIEIVTAGSSIGAFNALTAICRYPEVFRRALCMSGTYDLSRFLKGPPTESFYRTSPLHFLPGMEEEAAEPTERALHPARVGRRRGRGHR